MTSGTMPCGPGPGTDRCGCGSRTDRDRHGTETCRRTGQSFTYSTELGGYCYHRQLRESKDIGGESPPPYPPEVEADPVVAAFRVGIHELMTGIL